MNYIKCKTCKNFFKLKYKEGSYKTICPFCGQEIYFFQNKFLKLFNCLSGILGFCTIIILVNRYCSIYFRCLLIILDILYIFFHKTITCYIYNKSQRG